ncbi:hypothetical protein [Reyranella sp.]|uniref:hypothetical protein n=1 Tax=Reyranella sp. TaxID=1929291 RepID=UPI003BAA5DA4
MRKVSITPEAVRLVERTAAWFETEQGPGFVPVIMWVASSTADPRMVPHLGLGFERREAVDRSRIMQCEGEDVEIFQYAPDELFQPEGRKHVDVRSDALVIVDTPAGP